MRTRFAGRLLGAVIPATLAGLATCAQLLWLGLPIEATLPASLVTPLAVPLGAILGFLHAPRVLDSRRFPLRTIALAALQAVIVGVVLVALVTAFTGAYAPVPTALRELAPLLLVIVIYGLVLFALPLYLATATFAAICALVGRRLARRGAASAGLA